MQDYHKICDEDGNEIYFSKTHSSIKFLGKIMLENYNSPLRLAKMPFLMMKELKKHKFESEIYKACVKINANLAYKEIEKCEDFKQSLNYKNQLSYKLGNAVVESFDGGGALCFKKVA